MQTALITLRRDDERVDKLLDFIRPRQNVPSIVEEQRVAALKFRYASMLHGARVPPERMLRLKRLLYERYLRELATPGDCVGVACAQFIGECITQSTLNTFHAAGMDTGIMTTMRKIEDIINLPKGGTTYVTLYPADPNWTFRQFYENTRHYVECVRISDVALDFEMNPASQNRYTLRLSLYGLYRYRIDEDTVAAAITSALSVRYDGIEVNVPRYESLDESAEYLEIVMMNPVGTLSTWYSIRKAVMVARLVGLSDVCGPHRFIRCGERRDEWCIELCCRSSRSLAFTHNVYDVFRTRTTRLRDVEASLGVEATKCAIVEISGDCLSDSVPRATIQLLSMILTRNGTVEPCTRFTMRSNSSPLAKIGFEECLEGCRNAGLFQEVERFNTVSSSIICGVAPNVGSNYSTLGVNLDSFFGVDRDNGWVEHEATKLTDNRQDPTASIDDGLL
ncbi:RNA polymerase subunit [Heliothis virescens ascovirus 3h]|uniref:DNA-directed RNA polymerase n=1 Tax=Heliothis virescens ascovirus 3h TaxID=1268039 RepID=A0A2K8ES95_9VIRU|nr:RNA polymerase subunit [Heliothis virescens ascovirus 3h]